MINKTFTSKNESYASTVKKTLNFNNSRADSKKTDTNKDNDERYRHRKMQTSNFDERSYRNSERESQTLNKRIFDETTHRISLDLDNLKQKISIPKNNQFSLSFLRANSAKKTTFENEVIFFITKIF